MADGFELNRYQEAARHFVTRLKRTVVDSQHEERLETDPSFPSLKFLVSRALLATRFERLHSE
jgi:hypothetical protein